MMDAGTLNLAWAQALVDGLAAAGVRHAVISPGSRSTPLALAFLRQTAIQCRVVIDERSAGFFALGLAKGSGNPVALLCTSGSAPANWFPAVIEADQGGVPLLLLSADRPPELRGWGANQTVDQQNFFGAHVRAAHALGVPGADFNPGYLHRLAARVVAECQGALPGPVHVNLPFPEPLLPAGEWPPVGSPKPVTVARPRRPPAGEDIAAVARCLSGRPGAIVCGGGDFPAGFAQALAELAARLDAPVLAEPLSGLRFGGHDRSRLCVRYEAWLRGAGAGLRPEWLLRFGAFPVSRSLQNWLGAASGATQVLVSPGGRWLDPLHAATTLLEADPVAVCQALLHAAPEPAHPSWRAAFAAEENRAGRLAAEHGLGTECFEGALITLLLERLPAGHRLLCGNSMAIRDLDSFSGSDAKPIAIHGNRGASGIDGNVSTAAGLAVLGPTLALVGDVSCAHDLNGLAAARGLDLVLVVVNNGGGGIFGYLPAAALPDFERVWLTPPGLDFFHAAGAWGIAHRRAETLPDFAAALDSAFAAGGPQLIEVVVDREASLRRHRAYWEAVASA
ncbi:MAG: 2-succinyl-5-enolpyruvyl-6-hydroxy-3-cyclohexene-1-carboxylic-acid synthase [Rhodocyclaceae bacterium]|nr:2-succinyl-5-enolpyruvyl-6-hydroxy-3-cyclohexene-1-carboxylic-acid synthase [Rhodocyclaceae bacterium]